MRTARSAHFVVARLAAFAVLAAALMTSSAAALDINTEVSLQDGEVGVPYEFQFTGEEGCQPYNFSYKSGTLPPGLTIQRDGKLVGTPTVAGTFVFWIELTDGIPGGACHSPVPSQGEYSVIIAPQVVITARLLGAKVGVPYKASVSATGGGSLEWSVSEGALPPGLSLNRADGTLSGTPSTVGSFPFTVKVKDDKRKATQQYAFVVAAPLSVQPSVSLPAAEVGVRLNASIGSNGGIGPLSWSIASGSLPGGLSLDVEKGVIKGTPTSAGAFSVPVTVTDSDGQTAKVDVRLAIARKIAIATTQLAKATVGKSYRVRLAARGGVGPVSWRLGAGPLPRGLALNRSTGVLAGLPRVAGTYRFTIRLTDKLGAVATRTVTLTVAART